MHIIPACTYKPHTHTHRHTRTHPPTTTHPPGRARACACVRAVPVVGQGGAHGPSAEIPTGGGVGLQPAGRARSFVDVRWTFVPGTNRGREKKPECMGTTDNSRFRKKTVSIAVVVIDCRWESDGCHTRYPEFSRRKKSSGELSQKGSYESKSYGFSSRKKNEVRTKQSAHPCKYTCRSV
jgi:hypothetical protein